MQNESLDSKQIFTQSNLKMAQSTVRMQEDKNRASDSTKTVNVPVNSNTAYYVDFCDVHLPESNLFEFVERLKKVAAIPNCFISLGADMFNNSTKSSIGDTQSEVCATQAMVKMAARAILEANKEVPILDKIIFINSGNHEYRSIKETSLDPTYMLACELGLQDKYVQNISRVNFQLQRTEKPTENITVRAMITHEGLGSPSSSGMQAQTAFAQRIDQGVDLVVYEHNHKVAMANTERQNGNPNKLTVTTDDKAYVNFGSSIVGGDYADKANYPYPRVGDLEVLRMTNIEGKRKFDLVNYRSLVNQISERKLGAISSTLASLESSKYSTVAEIKKHYTDAIKSLMKDVVANNDNKAIRKDLKKPSDELYLVLLSGLDVGNEDRSYEDKQKYLDKLANIGGKRMVVYNGNNVHYKKAITLVNKNGSFLGEKFPEDSFSYLETLSKNLEPFKSDLVVFNYGKEEQDIMKYQSEALAKMAMNRLQMDEKLCYEPYNKTKLESEKLKIQAKQVENYNKGILAKAVENALEDVEEAIREALPYSVENFDKLDPVAKEELIQKAIQKYEDLPSNGHLDQTGKVVKKQDENAKLDYLKDILSLQLRSEGEFLNLSKDKNLISFKFPLKDIELRTPNANLIANIICSFLQIDPKQLVINPSTKTDSFYSTKIRDNNGNKRIISFVGSASNSVGSRVTIERDIRGKQINLPLECATVYYTNTPFGKELMALDKSIYTDDYGAKHKYDIVFISGSSFSNELSTNRIYKLFAQEKQNEQVVSNGIYENADEPFALYCEDLSYDTIMLQDDIVTNSVKEKMMTSYNKTLQKFYAQQADKNMDEISLSVDKNISKFTTKTKTKKEMSENNQAKQTL